MSKISIIIPVYNVEKYLRECLNSVVHQTLKDIEIICINDGSTDESGKILQEFADKDKRIKIIEQENKGQSAARNIGIRQASGEFIGFVDSDDWIDLGFYEKLYNAAVDYNADIACAGIRRCFSGRKSKDWLKYNKFILTGDMKKKFELCRVPKYHYIWNKIYNRKKFLSANIFFEEGIFFEDLEFTHKVLFYMPKLVTVPDVKYYYRDNVESTVNFTSERHYADLFYAIKKCQKFIKTHYVRVGFKYYNWLDKKVYKIFGIPVLIVKKNEFQTKAFLFGLIPVFSVTHFTR